ncbi:hypothetical protein N8462_01060 [bacterium]|nr:hypothetical protein [bacterium]|tara:strand:- start:276 stop:491 length:216 start_codon:yes stop_codon:yes gene_type:complete
MEKTLHLEIDGVTAILYFLENHVEVHFMSKKLTFVEGGERLLGYLRKEGFVTAEPIKLISLYPTSQKQETS